jgi:hypothetical protein
MGTHEYERLPKTPQFKQVVGLIGAGAGFGGAAGVMPGSVGAIADATLDASLEGLEKAKHDPGLSYAFYLLSQLTRAAREDNFLAALADLGLPAPKATIFDSGGELSSEYDIYDLVASYTSAVDRELRRNQSRSDIGELGQQTAAESLTALCGPKSNTLFGTSLETVKDALRTLSTQKGFATLTQDFFARLTRRYILYHLSRELSRAGFKTFSGR